MRKQWKPLAVGTVLAIACLFHGSLEAQCPQNANDLYRLGEAYTAGKFEDILKLAPCVQSLCDSLEKDPHLPQGPDGTIRAIERLDQHGVETFLHIFSKTAIAADRPDLAQMALQELVILNPRYMPNADEDPYRLWIARQSVIPYAANFVGLVGGASLPIVRPMALRPLFYQLDGGIAKPLLPAYSNGWGYHFGIQWQHFFGYRHGFTVGFLDFAPAFRVSQQSPTRVLDGPDPRPGEWQITLEERLHLLQLPLGYAYRIPLRRTELRKMHWLSLQAGVYGQLLVGATARYELTFWELQDSLIADIDEDVLSGEILRRKRLAIGMQAGISFQVEQFGLSWLIGASAQLGFTQLRKPNSLYQGSFPQDIWNTHLTDNDFKIHALNLSVGFLISSGNRIQTIPSK